MTWNSAPSRKKAIPAEGSQSQLIEEAIETLEEVVERKNVIFLWTGGKEAQVVADLLLYAVGDEDGVSPVPFGVIDTGNQFEEMYDFRGDFLAADGDQGADTVGPFEGIGNNVIVEKYDEFLEHIINNENDPRGYHGKYSGGWKCPGCGEIAELGGNEIICEECGEKSRLHNVQRQNKKPEEWGVPESCGALKVIPLKRFVEKHGFETMITGIRGSDMIATDENSKPGIDIIEEKKEPTGYTRVNPLKNWEEANIWAYLKMESVSYPILYDKGYRHTDSKCCTDEEDESREYGEGGIDSEKAAAKNQLQEMGYI